MFNLSFLMLERVGLVIILAYLLVSIPPLRQLLYKNQSPSDKVRLVLIFSIFAIFSNLTGIEIDQNNNIITSGIIFSLPPEYSIANTRLLSVTVSGIVGGPYVGMIVGLITGIHRVLQGGIAGWFYIPSSIIVGLLSGILFKQKQQANDNRIMLMTPRQGLIVGFTMELVQMVFILFFSPTRLELVKFIFVPVIVANTIGTFIFLTIIKMFLNQETETRAVQTHDVLDLADTTLPYLRNGLNLSSAGAVVSIIQKYTNYSAISLTSTKEILAYIGAGSDHHVPTKNLVTKLSEKVIKTNKVNIAHNKSEIGCSNPNCPLEAAIVVPLSVDEKVFGTLKMYFTDNKMLTPVDIQLAEGLGSIFSSQIALGEAENQSKLLKDAKIKSLQAQINPHFFFNAINTISAMIRIDATKARSLLIELSTYFRANLTSIRETKINLSQELEHVDAYLSLEQARFPDKYQIDFDIETPDSVILPPFTIQVLLENAIKHAFHDRKKNNIVNINVTHPDNNLQIQVKDNGFGIDESKLALLGKEVVPSESGSGTALQNLNQRLQGLYNSDGKMKIETNENGTNIIVTIPYEEANNENISR